MKIFRKSLSILLCIALFSCIFALGSSAATESTYGDLTYTIDNGKITITDCKATATTADIPATIDGYPVTAIGNEAFYECSAITSVTIPEGVESVGRYAFYYCNKIKEVAIPDSVKSIGSNAFGLCTRLEKITIGKGVTSFGNYVFYNCTKLASITVSADNTAYTNDEYGVLYNKSMTQLVAYPAGSTHTDYTVSEDVTSIGNYAFFASKNLKNLTILNRDCAIYDVANTIPAATVINGLHNSTAEAFAVKYDRTFTVAAHDYIPFVSEPTCTEQGFTTYSCEFCDETYVEDYVDATGHADENGDFICDADCGYEFENDCDHLCHNDGFLSFFWKIALFFQKLFRTNQYCECGVAHW